MIDGDTTLETFLLHIYWTVDDYTTLMLLEISLLEISWTTDNDSTMETCLLHVCWRTDDGTMLTTLGDYKRGRKSTEDEKGEI